MSTRIELEDSILTIMTKMAGSNPGAASVLVQIVKYGDKIDPDSWSGKLSPILSLDSIGIYESDIWKFYKYICNEDIVKVIVVLRAINFGFLLQNTLLEAIQGKYDLIDIEDLLSQVKKELPSFNNQKIEDK